MGIEVTRVSEKIIKTRRHLHAHPELAFQEVDTAALVARRCVALGLSVRTGVGGTGVLAELSSGRAGPTVLVRADMDALPIQEGRDGRQYRSTVAGVMHACGHDGHVAIALGVAEILARLRSHWSGRVRMCFQPAEEVDQGAERMITEGALTTVGCAVGLHLQSGMQTGTIAIGAGVQWASCDELRMTIHGAGGHAGDPRETVDPIVAAAEVILKLQRISQAPTRGTPGVVTVTQIQAGTAANIIPETVAMAGTLRAMSELERRRLLADSERAAREAARARGAALQFALAGSCPALVCDPDITDLVRAALETSLPCARVVNSEPSTGADDMARFLQKVPGCYFRVGASDLTNGPAFPHHHPLFDLDERALSIGAHALARATLALLVRDEDRQNRGRGARGGTGA